MQEMHYSMVRLYQIARKKETVGQSAVAHKLNISPQRVKNWETRGISEQGARMAQAVFGCNANWLLDQGEKNQWQIQPQLPPVVKDPSVTHLPAPKPDRMTQELLDLFSQLDAESKREYLMHLRGFVAGRRPHRDGDAPAVAGK